VHIDQANGVTTALGRCLFLTASMVKKYWIARKSLEDMRMRLTNRASCPKCWSAESKNTVDIAKAIMTQKDQALVSLMNHESMANRTSKMMVVNHVNQISEKNKMYVPRVLLSLMVWFPVQAARFATKNKS